MRLSLRQVKTYFVTPKKNLKKYLFFFGKKKTQKPNQSLFTHPTSKIIFVISKTGSKIHRLTFHSPLFPKTSSTKPAPAPPTTHTPTPTSTPTPTPKARNPRLSPTQWNKNQAHQNKTQTTFLLPMSHRKGKVKMMSPDGFFQLHN